MSAQFCKDYPVTWARADFGTLEPLYALTSLTASALKYRLAAEIFHFRSQSAAIQRTSVPPSEQRQQHDE